MKGILGQKKNMGREKGEKKKKKREVEKKRKKKKKKYNLQPPIPP